MKYIISFKSPHQHYIDIEFVADLNGSDETLIQLPAWRPGRYELANFAKNIQKWSAHDENNTALEYTKITKDCWKVKTTNVTKLHIRYNYYSNELNAGSTYLDASQLYVNPVNCCVYIPSRIAEVCEAEVKLPTGYKIACGLESSVKGTSVFLSAIDFHELVDSPFIASDTLQQQQFFCGEIEFNIWFQGECKPDWERLKEDFLKFCDFQLRMMKNAPFKAYHFLFQITPYRFYHGVEHTHSTVLALGPGYNLMKGKLYEDVLGVCCHELFHAWNVKSIRPYEMEPYEYSKENYSRLGYVCEGVTTYYGDQILSRCGAFTEAQFNNVFNEQLQKHVDNFGRFNHSVADSSFDTWLDGYVSGVPNRKTSIYVEGCLLGFITDVFIRKNAKNKFSLDDVMVFLYEEFAMKKKGYTTKDYVNVISHFANTSFDPIADNLINAAADYQPFLRDAMSYIGCELVETASSKFHEHAMGVKVASINGVYKVIAVYPGSVADVEGISLNDEIVAVNGMILRQDSDVNVFAEWCNYFEDQPIQLTVSSSFKVKSVTLTPRPMQFYKTVKMLKSTAATTIQKLNYQLWCGYEFDSVLKLS